MKILSSAGLSIVLAAMSIGCCSAQSTVSTGASATTESTKDFAQRIARQEFDLLHEGRVDRRYFTDDAAEGLSPEAVKKIQSLLAGVGDVTSFKLEQTIVKDNISYYAFEVDGTKGEMDYIVGYGADNKIVVVHFK